MKGDLNRADGSAPTFFYHLGDVVYYNGQITDYYSQFYEPYNHYNVPILGIPGNHDGDPQP
jgi:acid phosphatase type 7